MKFFLKALVVVLLAAGCFPQLSWAGYGEALHLSENPPADQRGEHKGGHMAGQRGVSSSHSEHRAAPVKKFYLNLHDLSGNAKAYVMRPDGSMTEGSLSHDAGWTVTFDTTPMDSSMDGIFNLYIVDRKVVDGVLLIRVAKMNVINHSCGWGHKHKFDKERLAPKHLDSVPLEIIGYGLWNENFHTRTMSGDRLDFKVLSSGRPADGAKIRIRTQTGWTKTSKTDSSGNFSVQLIRDYYPEKWSDFKTSNRGTFLITAELEAVEKGEFEGLHYDKVSLITTLPWKYQPQRKEYTSYGYGISIAAVFAVVSGAGIYIHRQRRRKPYREAMFDEKD